MEQKTKVSAKQGEQEILISRIFDLPRELLFKAYTEPEIVEQWMGTKVIKFESKKHGAYRFETTDPRGNKFGMSGVIHDFIPGKKIIRTFEMERMTFGVQLEVLEFGKLTDNSSKLNKKIIYESVFQRDQHLKLPFVHGINMAHSRLQEIVSHLK